MRKQSVSKLVAGAVALALASAAVHAGPVGEKSPNKEQKIGMASGTIIGAIVGGPIGAAVGFIAGTLTGTGAADYNNAKKSAKSFEQQLAATRNDLQSAQQELTQLAASKAADKAESDAKFASIYDQFAQHMHADVLFRTASADLDPAAGAKLADLGKVLGAYSNLVIDIDGYADPRGKSTSNDELSEQRAMAVRAALIVGGASPDRVRVSAHGAKLSTAAKDDLEAYAWERRVSLSVQPVAANSGQVAQAK